MEIRQLTGMEQQEAIYIWSQSFEHGDRAMEEWKAWEARVPTGRETYGIYESGLQAAFLLVDETVRLGEGVTVPMSAVCGVGVLPSVRGRGYASAGVRAMFERMRDAGRPISYLEPFSWEFYGKLGYAWTAPTRRYTAPTRLLKSAAETERGRAATASDRSAIVACYATFAGRYRGMLERRPDVWDWMLDASPKVHTYTYLYEGAAGVEGYLIYHGGTRDKTNIDEFIALSPAARRGLLGLLRRHEMQIASFRWEAPADDLLWSTLLHSEIATNLTTRTMARIVDVPLALEALNPDPGARCGFTAAIRDESAPWNDGAWRIEIESGRVAVSRSNSDGQVSLDIQAVTQAYLGSPTVAELRRAGRMEVHDGPAYRRLEALLAGPPSWCADRF